MKDELANVTVVVNSRVGDVIVEVLIQSVPRGYYQVPSGSHNFSLDSFAVPFFGYNVTVILLPMDRTFSRQSEITINVAGMSSLC